VQELEIRPAGAIDYERVRAEVPECAGLSDHQIDLCAAYMRFAHASKDDKAEVDCALHGRRSEAGILAAIDACRVEEEPDRDPAIPEGLSDGALGALVMVAQKPRGLQSELALELGALVCGTLVDSGTASYYEWAPNHTGRALAAKLAANMRCKVVEPEPEEQWSEPAGKMDVEECAALCWTLGDMLEMTAHMGGKWTWKLSHGDGRAAHGNSSCSACECAQDALRDASRNASRYDAATDRVRLDGLEVV
jgi:hypothetical protein